MISIILAPKQKQLYETEPDQPPREFYWFTAGRLGSKSKWSSDSKVQHTCTWHTTCTVGHKDGIFYFLHNFMGHFLLWEIFRMSRVFTITMLSRSTSLFVTYSHKIRQHSPSTKCVLSLKRKGATGTAELRILSQFIHFSNNSIFGGSTAS